MSLFPLPLHLIPLNRLLSKVRRAGSLFLCVLCHPAVHVSPWGHSEQQHCEMCQVLARHLQVSFIFLAKLKTRIEGLVAQAG